MNQITIALLWVLFCIIHSALIAVSTTRLLKRILRDQYRWFRLSYNIFSLVTFLLMIVATANVPGEEVFVWDGWLRIPQYLLLGLAIGIFFVAGKSYNMSYFIGIEQLRSKPPNTPPPVNEPIVATGIHGLVRHPWYTSVFILLWVSDMNTTEFTTSIILSGYLVVGTLLEERKLVLEFGQTYIDYKQQVSMLVPWKWLMKRFDNNHQKLRGSR